ncbi:uncharacterized protein EI90DRAFT_8481 [Cantharellus anzutake]|uniref:uncharacterized protein n=1 Tax=Cantharellus anzutake TaxID=1750568 RepID=UPI0019053C93|nr:uncharacterized protein EI90DRAFT_8481 [Cantharellus anzutake]KAF8343832.1 hypothetical protein EI90DRAFT_8481 [Cantharellus anzutake]
MPSLQALLSSILFLAASLGPNTGVATAAKADVRDWASARTAHRHEPPVFKHIANSNVLIDLDLRAVPYAESYRRVNTKILGGNVTLADGTLIAHIVPGIGGEQGYIDNEAWSHLDARYTIQFVKDNSYGFVRRIAFSPDFSGNYGFAWIETDSTIAKEYTSFIVRFMHPPANILGRLIATRLYASIDDPY